MTDLLPVHIHDTRPLDDRMVCHGCGHAEAFPRAVNQVARAEFIQNFVSIHRGCGAKTTTGRKAEG